MADKPEPRRPWLALTVIAICSALFWLADGRFWPSLATDRHGAMDGLFVVLAVNLLLSLWRSDSPLRRAVYVLLAGAYLWFLGEAVTFMVRNGEGRMVVGWALAGLALVAVVWGIRRLPQAWRRKAQAAITRGGSLPLLSLYFPGWTVFEFVAGKIGLGGLLGWMGVYGVAVVIAAGLYLAGTRLSGWRRNFTCLAIASLAWIVGGAAMLIKAGAGGDVMSWILTMAPPVIAAGVMTAHWRIDVGSRAAA